MIQYGAGPASDEVEISLFGPGYGEAIAVHLGEGAWLLVDSCIERGSGNPASGQYLDQIGVRPDQVLAIVASHWHDDHVRGISALAAKYPNAEFVISSVFTDKEAQAFLAAYSGAHTTGLARGSKELFSAILDREKPAYPAHHRSIIIETQLNGRQIRVTALSPLPAANAQFVAHVAGYLPRKGQSINTAPELKQNMEAVAIHIDLGGDAVLLGADLEDHAHLGWSAIVSDGWSGKRQRATAFKVAHHGSYTGDSQKVWSQLLSVEPVACLTPFARGKVKLPTDADRERIRGITPNAYISSGASRRPEMDRGQLKRLSDICKNICQVDNGFGAVRLRKKIDASAWGVELFGAAQAL